MLEGQEESKQAMHGVAGVVLRRRDRKREWKVEVRKQRHTRWCADEKQAYLGLLIKHKGQLCEVLKEMPHRSRHMLYSYNRDLQKKAHLDDLELKILQVIQARKRGRQPWKLAKFIEAVELFGSDRTAITEHIRVKKKQFRFYVRSACKYVQENSDAASRSKLLPVLEQLKVSNQTKNGWT